MCGIFPWEKGDDPGRGGMSGCCLAMGACAWGDKSTRARRSSRPGDGGEEFCDLRIHQGRIVHGLQNLPAQELPIAFTQAEDEHAEAALTDTEGGGGLPI